MEQTMPSLGFSVEHKAPSPRRAPAPAVLSRPRQTDDGGFVIAMIALGLLLLAAGAWHAQLVSMLERLAGV
jgi:hypothetical protein